MLAITIRFGDIFMGLFEKNAENDAYSLEC